MARGEAKRCTGHVGIDNQQAAIFSQYQHTGHIKSWSHYCEMHVECIGQNECRIFWII